MYYRLKIMLPVAACVCVFVTANSDYRLKINPQSWSFRKGRETSLVLQICIKRSRVQISVLSTVFFSIKSCQIVQISSWETVFVQSSAVVQCSNILH